MALCFRGVFGVDGGGSWVVEKPRSFVFNQWQVRFYKFIVWGMGASRFLERLGVWRGFGFVVGMVGQDEFCLDAVVGGCELFG